MANILVYIELEQQRISRPSVAALCAGRRIATGLGATLHAVVPCDTTPDFYGDEDIVARLSGLGADKVVLTTNCQESPALYATHGPGVLAVCERFPPTLVLFPSPAGADLGPRVAYHLQALYCPDARLQLSRDDDGGPEFTFEQPVFRRRFLWRQSIHQHRPTVLTLAEDSNVEPLDELGEDEAEVVIVQAPRPAAAPFVCEEIEQTVAPPRVVVGGGSGLGHAQSFAELERLAGALAATPAASTTAHEQGVAGDVPQIGLDGAPVAAGLYLAFGISGSDRHLAALEPETFVVAINTDSEAPIFRVAQLGLVADAERTVAALLEAVGKTVPEGDVPEGDVPEGDVPEGDVPDGDVPDGDVPDGDVPDGDVPGEEEQR